MPALTFKLVLIDMQNKELSKEYVDHICKLYGDIYDDRIEDCRPPAAGDESREAGDDWRPGCEAAHKSLSAFRDELMAMGSGCRVRRYVRFS